MVLALGIVLGCMYLLLYHSWSYACLFGGATRGRVVIFLILSEGGKWQQRFRRVLGVAQLFLVIGIGDGATIHMLLGLVQGSLARWFSSKRSSKDNSLVAPKKKNNPNRAGTFLGNLRYDGYGSGVGCTLAYHFADRRRAVARVGIPIYLVSGCSGGVSSGF
jgi:hypothetical protein